MYHISNQLHIFTTVHAMNHPEPHLEVTLTF